MKNNSRCKKVILHSKLLLLLIIEVAVGVFSSISLAYFFLKILTKTSGPIVSFLDSQISNFIYGFRQPWLTSLMIFISDLGAEYSIVLSILIVIILIRKKHKREAFNFIIILIMGFLINYSLKGIIQRPRPDLSPLVTESYYSFPSGHAMNSTVFYLTLSFYFFHFTRKKKMSFWLTVLSLIMIGLIGLSRVYLGVHFPSDIAAGYIIGFWWFITAILISKTIDLFNVFKEEKNDFNQ